MTEYPVIADGTLVGYVIDHELSGGTPRQYEATRLVTDANPDGWLHHDPVPGYSAWHDTHHAAERAVLSDAAKDTGTVYVVTTTNVITGHVDVEVLDVEPTWEDEDVPPECQQTIRIANINGGDSLTIRTIGA